MLDMWLNFKAKWVVSLLVICSAFESNAQQSEVIYNLRQNWVQYSTSSKGYLPVVTNIPTGAISFDLDCNQYQGKVLFIYSNVAKAYLFHNKTLITHLSSQGNYIDIDSLSEKLGSSELFLTVYQSSSGIGLQTYIVNSGYRHDKNEAGEQKILNPGFASYFIIISIFLYVGLVLIKLRYPELFNQYGSFQRTFNPQTIDELIYKGRFFVAPGIIMIIWMSLTSGFITSYLANKVGSGGSTFRVVLEWLGFSSGFFIMFLLRYMLITGLAQVFDMAAIRNVHFANLLRLIYYLIIVLLVAITLDNFSVLDFEKTFFLKVIFGALFIMIILIGIRLSFIIRHTFVHLFLYLCGTEIFLFAFVYKVVVG